jgi:hypothetical protein
MFIERVQHANGSATLISWTSPNSQYQYRFDTYFRAGINTLQYSGNVDADRKIAALASCQRLSGEWHEIPLGTLPEGVGFVVGNVILAAKRFNVESWEMAVRRPGNFGGGVIKIESFARESVGPGLFERAKNDSLLAQAINLATGLKTLRRRVRSVGSIRGEEVLMGIVIDGKQNYSFVWEAPGKAYSLAEPLLVISLDIEQQKNPDHQEPFISEAEVLELWDGVVDSIRLRPGAA